jgi:hypothetical protein
MRSSTGRAILEIEGPDDASQDQIMLAAQEIYSGLPEIDGLQMEAKHYSNQKRNPLVLRSTHRHPLSLARLSLVGLVALFYLLPLVLLSWQTLPQTDWALKIL